MLSWLIRRFRSTVYIVIRPEFVMVRLLEKGKTYRHDANMPLNDSREKIWGPFQWPFAHPRVYVTDLNQALRLFQFSCDQLSLKIRTGTVIVHPIPRFSDEAAPLERQVLYKAVKQLGFNKVFLLTGNPKEVPKNELTDDEIIRLVKSGAG